MKFQDISEKYVKIPNRQVISAILLSAANILLRYRYGSSPVYREKGMGKEKEDRQECH